MYSSIIVLDGLPAAGKSVLLSLLDGHDSLFVNPFHDGLISEVYSNKNSGELFLKKDIEGINNILLNTGYCRLKEMAALSRIPVPISSKNDEWKSVELNVNFEEFNSRLLDSFMGVDVKDRFTFVETHLSILNEYFGEKEKADSAVTLGSPKLYAKEFLSDSGAAKIIHIRRDVSSIVYAMNRRGAAPGRSEVNKSKQSFKKTFLNSWKWLSYHRYIDKVKTSFPDRVIIIDFEKIFHETESVMDEVCSFIGVEFDQKILLESWLNGKVLGGEVGEIQDLPELTIAERIAIIFSHMLPDFYFVKDLLKLIRRA